LDNNDNGTFDINKIVDIEASIFGSSAKGIKIDPKSDCGRKLVILINKILGRGGSNFNKSGVGRKMSGKIYINIYNDGKILLAVFNSYLFKDPLRYGISAEEFEVLKRLMLCGNADLKR
jgi:hypothetical protein